MVDKVKYNSVEEIPVWQKSHELVLYVYRISKKFPKSEVYGFTNQLLRCVVSIPANISEGFYRRSIKELLQFLYISRGSLGEAKYYFSLAFDLEYLALKEYNDVTSLAEVIGKQLNGWISSLRKLSN